MSHMKSGTVLYHHETERSGLSVKPRSYALAKAKKDNGAVYQRNVKAAVLTLA